MLNTPPARVLLWVFIAAFLLAGGYWAFCAGLTVRQEVWDQTWSIRYYGDMESAFTWGNKVLRYAEQRAGLPNRADALANNPKAGSDPNPPRRLTGKELLDGWVHYYDRLVDKAPDGQFDLDYPPMRLAIMTLWVRHAQRENPALKRWPQPPYYAGAAEPRTYEFVKPLLMLNTACAAATAVAAMALCWLWTVRQHRWRMRTCQTPNLHAASPLLPHGLVVFVVSASAFWYAWSLAAQPPPPPTPRICLRSPIIEDHNVTLRGIIDTEGIYDTQCRFQWGACSTYDHASPWRMVTSDLGAARAISRATTQPSQGTFHYRLQARNYHGVTNTDDQVYTPSSVQPDPTNTRLAMTEPTYGGFAIGGVGRWMVMMLLLIIMLVSARMLPPEHRGWACGAVAALFVWFDPMLLVDAHVWPQWDGWLLTFFIWAALAASLGAWEVTGLIMGIGIMFKGQLVMGIPILALWPLFAGKPIASLRFIAGLACGAAFILWPWMLTDPKMTRWAIGLPIAGLLIAIWLPIRKNWNWYALPIVLAALAILLVWPFGGWFNWVFVPLLCAAVLLGWKWWLWQPRYIGAPRLVRWLRPVHIAATLAMAGFAIGVWVSGYCFGGNFSWFKVGFAYGAVRWEVYIAMGPGSYANFPALLGTHFGWTLHDIVGTIDFPGSDWLGRQLHLASDWRDLSLRTVLIIPNTLCVIACAIAAAFHSRRRDPRVLLALCAPWMFMATCLGQMSARYQLWASVFSAMLIAVSAGWSLLHVLLTLLAAGMVLHQLSGSEYTHWPQCYRFFTAFYGEGSLVITGLALILLVGALTPSRREKPLC